MNSPTSIIIAREYLERVRKKSFIFTTLLFPVVMLICAAIPSLIMLYGGDDEQRVDIIDASGVISPALRSSDDLKFVVLNDVPLDIALDDKSASAVVYIPANVVTTGAGVKIYSSDPLGMNTEHQIISQITDAIEDIRLSSYDIANLRQMVEDSKCDLKVQTLRIGGEKEESSSSIVNFALGELLNFFLYMAILLYGQMVMTSIIEEKNNRVLELIVTSVKPTRLMLGKIAGIGLVAVTQILIWLVLMVTMSALLLPALIPADMMSEVSAMNAGTLDSASASVDMDLLQAMAMFANPGYVFTLFLWLLLFTVGGFLLYAAIFAAIGSAVDNVNDASQLSSISVFPIIFGLIFGMQAASAPSSTMALVTSLIPVTAPMVMMSRIPFGIPTWQIILSLVILFASVAGLIWLAAKIYRVGIFMYGKKPTIKDLYRWARYK